MSIYFYLVCDKHKEYCNAASTGGFEDRKCALIDSNVTLSPFIATHAYCGPLRVWNDETHEFDSHEGWTKANLRFMWEEKEREG